MKFASDILSKNYKILFFAIVAFIISAGILFLFKEGIGGKTFFMSVCIIAAYYSYHNLNNTDWKQVSIGTLLGLAIFQFTLLVFLTIKAANSGTEWDFMCFYMQGMLGKHNLNFYDPNSFDFLLNNIDFNYPFSESFKSEILNVGLLSPPITMLLFAPLASLSPETSRIVLSILVSIFILINAQLANIIFVKKERSIYSLLFIFIIIMLLPGTLTTINFNQTNFFLLFFLLLAIYYINKPISGIFLALSLIVKPLSGILILFYILSKKWRAVIYFVATGIALVLLTGFIWGFDNILGFFESPPTQRIPQFLYEENVNQSLISILNQNLKSYGFSQHLVNFSYYLGSIFIIGLTFFISLRFSKRSIYLSFFPFIISMLIIYPSSLSHYMVYLLPLFIYFLLLVKGEKYLWLMLLPALSFAKTEIFFTYLILLGGLFIISLFFETTDNEGGRFELKLP
jgi:hypothetical protein